jgi:hypothetical protein
VTIGEEVFVELQPQINPADFVQAVDAAMSAVEERAEEATSAVEDAFDSAAGNAASSLDDIDPDFDDVSTSADDAGADVETAFDEAASAAETALQGVDGDGFTLATDDAQEAAGGVSDAFSQAADDASSSLEDVDADFGDVVDSAEDAASGVQEAFDGIDPDFSAIGDAADEAADALDVIPDAASDAVGAAEDAFSDADIASGIEASADDASRSLGDIADSAASSASDAESAFDGVGSGIGQEFDEAGDSADGLDLSLRDLVATAISLEAFRRSALAAEALNSQLIILDSQVNAAGTSVGFTTEQLEDMARASSIRLGVDTTDLITAQRNILLFADIADEQFTRATELSFDMATVMGRDVPGAARALGLALSDPTRGLTRLERQVGFFDQSLKDAVAEMVEMGDTAGANELILSELENRFGGVGEAARDSSARIAAASQEALRTLGGPIIAAVDDNIDSILSILESLLPVAENLGELVGVTVDLLAAAAPAIEFFADAIASIPDPALQVAAAFLAARAATRLFSAALGLLRAHPLVLIATGLAGVAAAVGLLGSESEDAAPGVNELELSIDNLRRGQIDELTREILNLNDGFREMGDRNFFQRVGDNLTNLNGLLGEPATSSEQLSKAFDDLTDSVEPLDQQFAALVQGGDIEAVDEALATLQEGLGLTDDEMAEFVDTTMPEYVAALELHDRAVQDAADAQEELGAATEEVGAALESLDAAPSAQSFVGLTQALADSELQAEDMAAVAESLGVDLSVLSDTVVPGVNTEFANLVSSVQSTMPGFSDAITRAFELAQEAERDLNFDDVRQGISDTLMDAEAFQTDLRTILDAGLVNLFELAVTGGPEIASAIVGGIGSEENVQSMENNLATLNEIMQEQTLQMAADAAVVSFFVGQALESGTLEGVEALPENVRSVIEDTVGVFAEEDPTSEATQWANNANAAIDEGIRGAEAATRTAWGRSIPALIVAGAPVSQARAATVAARVVSGLTRGWNGIPGITRRTFGVELPGNIRAQNTRASNAGRGVGRSAGSGMQGGINSRAGGISSAARRAINNAVSSARRVAQGGNVSGIGSSMASGITSGLGSSRSVANIIAAAIRLVLNAIAAARRAAGISSPSRLFAVEIGGPISDGIAEGILGGEAGVLAATQRVLDSAAAAEGAIPSFGGPGGDRRFAGGPDGVQTLTAAPAPVELLIRGDGSPEAELMVRMLQKAVRVRGGDVQEVLGTRNRGNGNGS